MPLNQLPTVENIAYRQNAPALYHSRSAEGDGDEGLTPQEVRERVTKWDQHDAFFKKLREDAVALYAQFEVNEQTIDAMSLPADSYAKTQIYKLEHFLRIYHERRCAELLDVLNNVLASFERSVSQESKMQGPGST